MTVEKLSEIHIAGGAKKVREMANHIYHSLRATDDEPIYFDDGTHVIVQTAKHGTVFLAENVKVFDVLVQYNTNVVLLKDAEGGETARC
jgi:lipase chaperone LimK